MHDTATTNAPLRETVAEKLLLLVLLLALPLGFASVGRIFHDGDTSWHLAVGHWIVRNREIPNVDVFSLTAAGTPWVAMEWLADLIFAGAHAVAGYAGVATLVAAALMALNGIVFVHARRFLGPIGLTVTVIGMDVVLATFILARPHVLAWPLLALWTVLLARSTENGRPPPLWTTLLLTAWTNVHASFPLAAMVGGCLALDALIATQWETLRQWVIFAAVSLLAVCINANGIDGLIQPFRVLNMETLHFIQEWLPSAPHHTPNFFGALLAVLGLLLWRGVRVPPGRLLLLLGLLGLAFMQVRHQSWLAIVAAVIVPPLLGTRAEATERIWPVALAAVPLLIVRSLWPMTPEEGPANPRHLLAAVPSELRGQPVFNEYTFGGPLILAGIRPYIDGRADMYGDEFMIDYVDIAAGDMDKFNKAVRRYGIRWTMLPAEGSKLGEQLDKTGQWPRIYSDKVGVIRTHSN